MQPTEQLPALREDQHGVMPLVPLSLYQIEAALDQLFQVREQAEEDGDTEAVAVIDQEIEQYFARKVRKVEGIAHSIRACERNADVCKEEIARLQHQMKVWESRRERIKLSTLRAMRMAVPSGPATFTSPTSKLRIQANGGLQPLEISNPLDLPSGLTRVTVRMTGDCYQWLCRMLEESEVPLHPLLKTALSNPSVEPDGDRIRAALKGSVVCPQCAACAGTPEESLPCHHCGGKGTIPATVPGAKLLPRGEHLRCE